MTLLKTLLEYSHSDGVIFILDSKANEVYIIDDEPNEFEMFLAHYAEETGHSLEQLQGRYHVISFQEVTQMPGIKILPLTIKKLSSHMSQELAS